MIPIETLTTFLIASVLLSIAPGPDNIYVLTQSALHGRWSGIHVTLGLCTGLVLHTSAVALGVAAIFQASDTAFTTLKLVGALYLLYLAWQAFHASSASLSNGRGKPLSAARFYRRGIVMNVTNPKVSIFFLAFLPQFTNPSQGSIALQIFLLGALFIIAALLVFGCIAFFAGAIGDWLKHSPRAQVVMNRLAGTIFVGLAINLAISER